jgi:hypothetical protein
MLNMSYCGALHADANSVTMCVESVMHWVLNNHSIITWQGDCQSGCTKCVDTVSVLHTQVDECMASLCIILTLLP